MQEQLNRINESQMQSKLTEKENERPSESAFSFETETNTNNKKLKAKLTSSGSKAGIKIRGQASKLVSSFKTSQISCTLVREFSGHTDGIWECTANTSTIHPLIATASADHLACIWSIDSGKCLLKYEGHSGSVNSIKFHPSKDLMLTASGDNSAHIWQGAVNVETSSSRRGASSEEELDDNDDDIYPEEQARERIDSLRTPLQEFSGHNNGHSGHSSVVVCADWISNTNDQSPTQVITASWDRTAIRKLHQYYCFTFSIVLLIFAVWDIETKTPIQQLTGHDNELTHCCANTSNRLVVTSSRDSTFRLWDFR